jgi:phosphomannomutase
MTPAADPSVPAASFLGYAPVSLTFGTSGLRGLVKDITDLEAYVNVKGAIRYLLRTGDVPAGRTVVLAGDLRPSTERIMRASVQAIVDSGCEVEHAGRIPTPALLSHALSARRASVMVTGSHIPFDRNGIKLNKSSGEILKSDEAGIFAEVASVRAEEYTRTASASAFGPDGMLRRSPDLPLLARAAEEGYVRRYVTSFPRGGLSGLRVLVYQHSAVGRDILVRILRELGAEVVTAGRTETFVPIDTENVTDGELAHLAAMAEEAEASGGPLHAVVSTDGDSDRPLVLAVVPAGEADSRGRRVRFLPGDLLGIVAAEYLGARGAVVPVSANDAVEYRMRERGILLRKTRIGSPYVIAAIDQLCAAHSPPPIVGWEANGGFLTGSDVRLVAGTLAALPSRDSILPILANLFSAAGQGLGLSALWNRLPARFGRSGLIDGVPVAVSRAILAGLVPPGETTEVEFDAAGRPLDRSGEGALDARPAAAWQAVRASCTRFFPPELGFDDVRSINVLDGVRVQFRNGDVAHVRPSGNAPQLRIYSNSDTQERADRIVEAALAEPDGILRRMEKAFAGGAGVASR